MSIIQPKHSWDRGLDYEKTYRFLLETIKTCKSEIKRRNCVVLLVQLRNGTRVSEAIDACREMQATNSREVQIMCRKQRKNPNVRLVVYPEELSFNLIRGYDFSGLTSAVLRSYALKRFGFNTHSLRYAFVTHALRRGVSPVILAKITGHKDLSVILTYAQTQSAHQLLKDALRYNIQSLK